MRKSALFLLAVLGCFPAIGQLSEQNMPLIRYGDSFPDSLYQFKHSAVDIESGQIKTIRLEDYRDKLIILDFWFNGCKPCILSLNKLDSIQAVHGDDRWVVIPFTYQTAESSSKAFNRYKWNFTSIISDTQLRHHLLGNGFQDMAWIKDGKVIATPPSNFATWENISSVLDGQMPSMPLRAEMRQSLDPNVPLFESDNGSGPVLYTDGATRITGYSPDYRTEYLTHVAVGDSSLLYCNNLTIGQLLYEAYQFEIESDIPKEHGLVWDVGGSLDDNLLSKPPSEASARTTEDAALIRQWRNQYMFGYSRRIPGSLSVKEAARLMQKDLNSFLGRHYNLIAEIDVNAVYRYPELRCITSVENTIDLLTNTSQSDEPEIFSKLPNEAAIFSDLITTVHTAFQNGNVGESFPLVNGTGISLTNPVFYDLPGRIGEGWSLARINRALRRYGLVVVVVERKTPILHIREKT